MPSLWCQPSLETLRFFLYAFQLCLTEGAKDECNVVEVVARDHDNQEIAVPVANLRLSCQPMVSWSIVGIKNFSINLKMGGPERIRPSFLSSSSV